MHPVETVDADVLIVGGGFGGVWAALRAAELTKNVVLVEKAYVSRSGSSTISGGVTTCPLPEDDLDKWAEEFIVRGDYMCNQHWTRQLLEGQRERVAAFSTWGVPISRDDKGNIRRFASRGMVTVRCMQYSPKAAMEELRRQAIARGVRIVDRFSITELITSDGEWPTSGRVVGAFGFDVKTGACTAFRAKNTILATGQISMKGVHHVDNDTGDGVAMAYRAGARVSDLEFSFGGTFSYLMKRYDLGSYNVAIAHGAQLINARGERFMAQYDPVRFERSELSRVVAAFVKEMIDGRGPVFIDLRKCDDSYWDDLKSASLKHGSTILLSDKIPDPTINPLPIEPTWGFWSGGRGGIDVDLQCLSSVPGLYAAGATAKNPTSGTHASAGVPTAFAMNSGYYAGQAAGQAAKDTAMPELSPAVLQQLAEHATAPLKRKKNGMSPDDLHDRLSAMSGTITEAMMLNGRKLERLIERSNAVYEEAGSVAAANSHELIKVHEARNVAENARCIYLSSADRTESREQFYREDYPDTDDDNWFCLHGMTRTRQGPRFERIAIPLESYPVKRPKKHPRRPSQMAAIFSGTYDPATYE